jgi:hypothetical protein
MLRPSTGWPLLIYTGPLHGSISFFRQRPRRQIIAEIKNSPDPMADRAFFVTIATLRCAIQNEVAERTCPGVGNKGGARLLGPHDGAGAFIKHQIA